MKLIDNIINLSFEKIGRNTKSIVKTKTKPKNTYNQLNFMK